MKKGFLLLVLFIVGGTFSVYPQTVKVTKFELVENDGTAARPKYGRNDYGGIPCGLIKIDFPMKEGVFFVGDIVWDKNGYKNDYHNGEWWVYMLDGANEITIKADGYSPYTYEFPEPIRGEKTYIMTIKKTNPNGPALLRSAFVPSWGQFYKGMNGRGTIIVIGETLALAAGGLSLYNELNQKSIMDKPEVSYQDYIAAEKSYEQWNTARHISFITAAVIYALNLADAYLTPAKSQNNMVFMPNVMNANGEMAVGATLSIRF